MHIIYFTLLRRIYNIYILYISNYFDNGTVVEGRERLWHSKSSAMPCLLSVTAAWVCVCVCFCYRLHVHALCGAFMDACGCCLGV